MAHEQFGFQCRDGIHSLKVLHVINTLSAGGAERHLLTLCRELRRRDVEVVVACLREKVRGSRSLRPEFLEEKIRVIDVQAAHKLAWRFPARVLSVVRAERPDVLHTHLARADLAGLPSARRAGVPWVCSIHDKGPGELGLYAMALPLLRHVWSRANAVIAISDEVRRWLVNGGLPDSRIAVIHYGIDPRPFDIAPRRSGLPSAPLIVSVGRLEARKGHATLIRAMPGVLTRFPDARLRIAGHDHRGYECTLKRLVAELSLGDRVTFLGYQDDVAAQLAQADVFALASRAEGFGQAVIEAMAAGRPVVVSRLSPFDEIVIDGQSGWLADVDSPAAFADAICAVLADPAAASRMGATARQRVIDAFSVAQMTDRTLDVYEQVCAGAQASA